MAPRSFLSLVVGAAAVGIAASQWTDEFDCGVRSLALAYANHTLGPTSLASVYAALNLSACNHVGHGVGDHGARVAEMPTDGAHAHTQLPRRHRAPTREGVEVFVSVDGSDTLNDGSRAKPFATVGRAQTAARVGGWGSVVTITAGTYYLKESLVLTNEDSGTTYQAAGTDEVVLSGGDLLTGKSSHYHGLCLRISVHACMCL